MRAYRSGTRNRAPLCRYAGARRLPRRAAPSPERAPEGITSASCFAPATQTGRSNPFASALAPGEGGVDLRHVHGDMGNWPVTHLRVHLHARASRL